MTIYYQSYGHAAGKADGGFSLGIAAIILAVILVGIPMVALGGIGPYFDYFRSSHQMALVYVISCAIAYFVIIFIVYKCSVMSYLIEDNVAIKLNGLGFVMGKWNLGEIEDVYVFQDKSGFKSIYFQKINRTTDRLKDLYLGFDYVSDDQCNNIMNFVNKFRKNSTHKK